jgi:hypothetical protein
MSIGAGLQQREGVSPLVLVARPFHLSPQPMQFIRVSHFFALPLVLLAGCVMNSVHQLSPDSVAKSEQAVLVYGIQVEGKWDYPKFTVQLVEYSLKDQDGAGNCFTFNRARAAVPSTPGAVKYFAFEVPAGHYTYGTFNGVPLNGETLAFTAVAGRQSYIGDFVYTSARQVELRRNSEGYKSSLPEVFPGTSGKFVLAEAVPVRPPKMFLCAP